MKSNLVFKLAYLLAATLVGIGLFMSIESFLVIQGSEYTVGKVVGIETKIKIKKRSNKRIKFPIVEFSALGQTHTVVYKERKSFFDFEKGEEVGVYYRPENPQVIRLNTSSLWWNDFWFIFFGGLVAFGSYRLSRKKVHN